MKIKSGVPVLGKMNARKKRGLQYLLMAIPFMVFVAAFCYVPLFGWYYAFTDYKIGQAFTNVNFVGLKHFAKLFRDTEVLRVLRNTLVMSGLSILTSPLPIIFAIMLSEIRSPKTKKLVQTVTTLPNFISWIVVYGVAFSIFSANGLWNQVLEALGLPTAQTGLIGEPDGVWGFQLMLGIWKRLGWSSIIYLAAIVGIDSELYDAAKVDGANKVQLIRFITVPGVMPTFLVLLLLDVGGLLSNGFDQYYIFWNTFTADRIEVLDYYVYKLAFRMGQYSYSIALGMLKSVISIILLGTVNWLSKKIRGYSLI